MTSAVAENSEPSSLSAGDADHHHPEDIVPDASNHEDVEPKSDISSDEIRGMMEVIAATGKFWHDWDMLKRLLSIRLKQVLAEYPEAKVVSSDGPQQSSLSGEAYSELVNRLDEALVSFIEGPPFTLQRLCEILLTPKSTYKSLSKLALALEKNLLVTSTLTICSEPYPIPMVHKTADPEQKSEELQGHTDLVPNGVESVAGDGDEEMAEAEVDEDVRNEETEVPQNVDTEMQVESAPDASEKDSEPSHSDSSGNPCTDEQQSTGASQES